MGFQPVIVLRHKKIEFVANFIPIILVIFDQS